MIVYYNRFVDDIFMIYNQTKITPQTILEQFNTQHRDLQFTTNEETDNQIAYLDLNLVNNWGQLEMEMYRNPTAMDLTINMHARAHTKTHTHTHTHTYMYMYILPTV
jgi:phage regulator Rha-like protein